MKSRLKKPCGGCPWLRTSPPGYLGADEPVHFYRQAVTQENDMPCHMTVDYTDPGWRDKLRDAAYCAGNLIFFVNNFKVPRRPELAIAAFISLRGGDIVNPPGFRDGRPLKIMRILAAQEHPVTVNDLIIINGETSLHENIQRTQTWYGSILRRAFDDGYTARFGEKEGSYQMPPQVLWGITQSGRDRITWLDQRMQLPSAADLAALRAGIAARRAESAADALAEAVRVLGYSASAHQRRQVVRGLRAAGCTLEAIGGMFGVTREQVRQDEMKGPEYRDPRRRGNSEQAER